MANFEPQLIKTLKRHFVFLFLIFISMFHVIVNLRCAGERAGERRSKGICLWEVPFVFIAMRDGA